VRRRSPEARSASVGEAAEHIGDQCGPAERVRSAHRPVGTDTDHHQVGDRVTRRRVQVRGRTWTGSSPSSSGHITTSNSASPNPVDLGLAICEHTQRDQWIRRERVDCKGSTHAIRPPGHLNEHKRVLTAPPLSGRNVESPTVARPRTGVRGSFSGSSIGGRWQAVVVTCNIM